MTAMYWFSSRKWVIGDVLNRWLEPLKAAQRCGLLRRQCAPQPGKETGRGRRPGEITDNIFVGCLAVLC